MQARPALYRPGSFSKEITWGTGPGLLRLHEAIRQGFGGTLAPVTRKVFRASCQALTPNTTLVALNFFLHNRRQGNQDWVIPDELVFEALARPHSRAFDLLALFALHLSAAGTRKGTRGDEGWHRAFVTTELWHDGAWRAVALRQSALNAFFTRHVQARPTTAQKCVSNYRHIMEMCGYREGGAESLNTELDLWAVSACFLLWDRVLGVGGEDIQGHVLRSHARNAQLEKLLGTTAAERNQIVSEAAALYIERRGTKRFGRVTTLPSPPQFAARPSQPISGTAPPLAIDPDAVLRELQAMEDARRVRRRLSTMRSQLRNRRAVANLKVLYGNRCMFCGEALQVWDDPAQY